MSRILLASHPLDGHFNLLTRLATYLKARGHDVRWYTGSTYAKKLRGLGIPHYPFARTKEIHAGNLSEHLPDYDDKPTGLKSMKDGVRTMFFARIEPQYRDVCDIKAGGFDFDVFMCDAALYMSRIVTE